MELTRGFSDTTTYIVSRCNKEKKTSGMNTLKDKKKKYGLRQSALIKYSLRDYEINRLQQIINRIEDPGKE